LEPKGSKKSAQEIAADRMQPRTRTEAHADPGGIIRTNLPIFRGTKLRPAHFSLDGQGALYEQLARVLKRAILEGRFGAGKRLPATRTLAKTLGLSRNTVLSAYELLSAEQLATARGRSGTHIAENARSTPRGRARSAFRAPSRYASRVRKLLPTTLGPIRAQPRYDLHYGEPITDPQLFHSWRRKLAAAALRAGPRYPEPAGFLPLRRAIAEHLGRRRGIACTEDEVLIVGGTQQAVTLAARVVLDEGDTVVIEDPQYQNVAQTLIAHGARVVSVRTDESGLVTAELAKHQPRLIYVTPSHQFPAGSILSLERRFELLRIAGSQGSWILEDDYDSEFQYRGRPLGALRSMDLSDRVIYVGTFSKTLFPSLRLGYIVCPSGLRDDLCTAKRLDDLGSPAIEQAALAAFMRSGQFEKYLRKSVAELRQRRNVLLEGLRRHAGERVEIHDGQAGVHVVVWFPHLNYPQLDRLIEIGIKLGLGLYPIHPNYRTPPARPGLLLGYAGLSATSLETATEIFGKCLDVLDQEAGSGDRRKAAGQRT
jgi:GntR family transcriptional regulator/MocR family aminotransferase